MLHEVADAVCLQMDARTAAKIGEAWSRGAAMMQQAVQAHQSEMMKMQAEVDEQAASVRKAADETRKMREGLEAVLRNVGMLAAKAAKGEESAPPAAADDDKPTATEEEEEPPAALLPVWELPEASLGSGSSGETGAEEADGENGDSDEADSSGFQTPPQLEPDEPNEAVAVEAPVAPAAVPAPHPAPAPPQGGVAGRLPIGGMPRQVPSRAAILLARAAALRAAAREVGHPGVVAAAAQRLAASARAPEALAPLLAPTPLRPQLSGALHLPHSHSQMPRLESWPEENEGWDSGDGADECQGAEGSSRSSTPSTAAGESFALTLRRVNAEMPFGLEVRADLHTIGLIVCGVRPGGVCEAWNRQNLGELRELRSGDRITSVNGVREAEAMREEFGLRLTVRLQVERAEASKGTGGSSPAESSESSTGRCTPVEASSLERPAQRHQMAGHEDSSHPLAGAAGRTKPGRHGRTRGARGRRGRGGKA